MTLAAVDQLVHHPVARQSSARRQARWTRPGPGGPSITELDATARQILEKVRMFLADDTHFGVLSTGERIAVAVVLDRYDLIQRS